MYAHTQLRCSAEKAEDFLQQQSGSKSGMKLVEGFGSIPYLQRGTLLHLLEPT